MTRDLIIRHSGKIWKKTEVKMRTIVLATIVAIATLTPFVSAHGANDYAIIMRNSGIEPYQADIIQNDSLIFYNVVDANRTIRVDIDGDGEFDQRCETEPSNSSSIRDECSFWIDPLAWGAGGYEFSIFSEGLFWKTLNVTIAEDVHVESGPPAGFTFNMDNGDEDLQQTKSGSAWESVAVLAGIVSMVLILRLKNED